MTRLVHILFGLALATLPGCAATIPPGPTFEQVSDAGTTRLVNQPPGALGIREDGLNWAATGSANVKAVRVNADGVLQLGSGPATRQVYWNPATNSFVLSSETDFSVSEATVFSPAGTPMYAVKGFQTSSSEPTRALAEPLTKWVEALKALSDDQRALVEAKMREQAETVKAVSPDAASVLSGLIKVLFP